MAIADPEGWVLEVESPYARSQENYHLNIPDGTDIVTIKSHEVDSELLTLCKKKLIILTRREPERKFLLQVPSLSSCCFSMLKQEGAK